MFKLASVLFVVSLLLAFATSFPCPASAQECYETIIITPNPFLGNAGELLKLADGSIWEVGPHYEYLYAYYPTKVIICPSRGFLVVEGKKIDVRKVGGR